MPKVNLKLSKWLWVIICLMTLTAGSSYLQTGLPQTHDGSNHLARFANYKIAFKEGQIPPRIAPNLMNRYTYPVFNYNYPLANLLSLSFSALKISYEITFKLLGLSFLFLGGVGVVKLIEVIYQLHNQKKPNQIKTNNWGFIFGLGIYYSAVYLFNLIVVRGNIGEIMAYGLWPWMLVSVLTPPKLNLKSILLWTSWWLVHNIMAVFGWPILVIVAFLKHGKNIKVLKDYLLLGIVSLLLSIWFWLPALAELSLVSAGHSQIVSDSPKHLLNISQVLAGTLEYGYSRVGQIDDLSFNLGLIQIIVLVLSMALILSKLIKNQKFEVSDLISLLLLLIVGALVVFQLQLTKIFWIVLKPLQLMQFPWRLSFFILPLLSVLAVFVWQVINGKWLKMLLMLVLLIQFTQMIGFKPSAIMHQPNSYWDAFPESTTTNNENKPQEFEYLLIGDWQPSPYIVNGDGSSSVKFWSGSKHAYDLQLTTPAIIIEPVMLFAGWKTTVNGNEVAYFDSDEVQGRLAYQLPAGEYQVESRFTQRTWPRILGNSLSLLTAIGLLIYIRFKKIKNRNYG